MDTKQAALARAIEIAGGQKALGARIGVQQSVISYWLREAKRGVAAEYVHPISAATGVLPHELRPDVYPQTEPAA